MQGVSEQTTTASFFATQEEIPTTNSSSPLFFETAPILAERGIEYSDADNHWQVGNPQQIQGWILHLSVILSQFLDLLNKILPFLIEEDVPFKIVRNNEIATKLLNGDYGPRALAKLITIYPPDDQKTGELASKLICRTKSFRGPSIPTDFHLGAILYTRYGSISPLWMNDPQGRPVKHIYNEKGELVPDPYSIPFTFPSSVSWPYHQIAAPIIPKPQKLINGRYYPISVMHENPRGNIIKAIYFKSLWSIKACVIKQGRRNMIADTYGRDVADRLLWQYEICNKMVGVIPVPKIFDYFTENGDTYMTMEYVKGKVARNWLGAIFNKRSWFDLPASDKITVLAIVSQIISIVTKIHNRGYLHRDITPLNFIITRKNKVVPIDLELSWPFNSVNPPRPFLLGTPGYMSPQQANAEPPTIKDDIYSLGIFILIACTRINSSQISTSDLAQLYSTLKFCTQDDQLSSLVTHCLHPDPAKRTEIATLQNTLASISATYKKSTTPAAAIRLESPSADKISSIIQGGINGLANPDILTFGGQWISNSTSTSNQASSIQAQKSSHIGWHTGVTGPLWLLALAKSAGFDIESCKEATTRSWDFIQDHFTKSPTGTNPSLFYGGAGVALAVIESIRSGLIYPNNETLSLLHSCFSTMAEELTLSRGIAGQGIALLQTTSCLNSTFSKSLIEACLDKLLALQTPDGTWPLEIKKENKNVIPLAFSDGISGVIWFLLSYLRYSCDKEIESATRKALHWLITGKLGKQTWKQLQRNDAGRLWFSARTPGDITILMLRAYKILGDPQYKLLAESNLNFIPRHPVSSNFSLETGLARIGEVCLEAFKVLGEERYWEKASWVTNFFLHTFLKSKQNEGYWNMEEGVPATADLFQGNSGILHYLLRYLKPDENPHPLY